MRKWKSLFIFNASVLYLTSIIPREVIFGIWDGNDEISSLKAMSFKCTNHELYLWRLNHTQNF